jgi:hypothetical protein
MGYFVKRRLSAIPSQNGRPKQRAGRLARRGRLIALGLVALATLAAGIVLYVPAAGGVRNAAAKRGEAALRAMGILPARPSPFLCGANLDPLLAANLIAAKQLGLTTVRFPDDEHFSANLALVKAAGLQPLIILHGSGIANPTERLASDIRLVSAAQQTFGTDFRVFYEIGNENDLESGLNATDYVAMWNVLVPRLKQLAPDSWFGGPVNYQANAAYAATLVHLASPKPDFVSWHEYTCPSSDPAATCIAHIHNWTTHVAQVINAIQANNDQIPPLMVTEWNYAPDGAVAHDDKHQVSAFMSAWTTTALQTLIASNVFGSYQFNVSNSTPLLGTAQGQAFHTACQTIVPPN